MKKLFVHYSNSGNGDFVAGILKEQNFDILKIETCKNIKKIGLIRMIFYGARASSKKVEKIKPFNMDFNKYDEIIFGSPVWADRISTPMNGFF